MKKYEELKEYIKGLKSVVVAFSGGVDSTLLLKAAHDALGNNAIAVTVRLCSFPERELNQSREFCEKEGIEQVIVELDELEIDGFCENPTNRCYLCKKEIFKRMQKAVGEREILEGSNLDDNGDYRPGLAAVAELGIKSPLRYVNLTKSEIREISKQLGLDTWEKPSLACLSSRFVYGERITREKLTMVEKAEEKLFALGFTQLRVRIHGTMARIEIPKSDFPKMLELSDTVHDYLKTLGFTYISLDLKGYRVGSMNETI